MHNLSRSAMLVMCCLLSVLQSSSPVQAQQKGDIAGDAPKTPQESAEMFHVPDDLRLDQLLTEPEIAQPLFLNFDERGRMWVVEYRQYPAPAGLKMLSRDRHWRAVYDKIPAAPPNHVRGADRISIHEDTNGDGKYDSHKIFVDGLNIATAVERGRGGVFILNPPYLLFYPDANNDDVPDGDPQVLLEGFGLEDTHSVVNSLRWGPDGWLYAAQGSTVSARVRHPGVDEKPVNSMGQLIWRYHPETKEYEIFAEGGGNAFGVEIDEKGRIFSGHNGGDTRGFHYMQGSYSRKGFTKHGPLSNPFAFGFFPMMKHPKVERFTHNFVLYNDQALPEKYLGKLFGVEPLQGRVVQSEIRPRGSTFETEDINHVITSDDRWFRPVDIKIGPDAAIYVCDWYDRQVSHLENSVGNLDNTNGRIYRLTARDAQAEKPLDLSKLSLVELIDLSVDGNRWQRQTALRLLYDQNASGLDKQDQQLALEHLKQRMEKLKDATTDRDKTKLVSLIWSIWSFHKLHSFSHEQLFALPAPHARGWSIRLKCDDGSIQDKTADKIAAHALIESDPEVRAQIACSARRLSTDQCLRIVNSLLTHEEDLDDPFQPLLIWWAVESKCATDPEKIVSFWKQLGDRQRSAIAKNFLAERLMQRFAAAGSRADMLICAKLFRATEDRETIALMLKGFEAGVAGRTLADLPEETMQALADSGARSLQLDLRRGADGAFEDAVAAINNGKTKLEDRVELVQVLGQTDEERSIDVLLNLVNDNDQAELKTAAILSLQNYADERIGKKIVELLGNLDQQLQQVAITMLTSRKAWTLDLLKAIKSESIDKELVNRASLNRATTHADGQINAIINEVYGDLAGASSEQMVEQIGHYLQEISEGETDRYSGKKLFLAHCAKCHQFFHDGETVGPDLTSYQRNDLRNMLISIVNPSAEIREGFENYLIETVDGRIVTGFKYDEDTNVVVIRGADGKNIIVKKDDIDFMEAQPDSLMPEGLLTPLTAAERRNLFAYLQSTQPLND